MLVCWYASAQVEILPPIFIRVDVFFHGAATDGQGGAVPLGARPRRH
jgi:hypothetical protein